MLTTLSTKSVKPRKGGVRVAGDSRARRDRSKIDGSEMVDVEVNDDDVEVDEVEKKDQKIFKSKNLSKSKKTVGLDFFTPGTRLAFTELRQVLVKAPIFHHFYSERHIRIKTDASGYAIGRVLSQLTSDDSSQWHLMAFFSCKMTPTETRYKTHDGELLAIVELFKAWEHYLEGS